VTPIAPHISAFLGERLPFEKRASEHTIASYAYAFQLLFIFAAKTLKTSPSALRLEQIDAPLVLSFLEHLERVRKNDARTRNARLAAIKSFMRFIEYRVPSALEQVRRILAIPLKRFDSRLVSRLNEAELKAVLDAPSPTIRMGVRDRAMISLASSAGLRVSELVGLCLHDITYGPRLSILIRGKGRRERALPLWKQTGGALRAWLAVRGDAAVPEVFLNARGERMTRSGFEYVLRRNVCAAAKLRPSLTTKRVSPHVLRHTCGMAVLRATGDIRKTALWLGHATVRTAEIYTRADPEEKFEVLKALVPPGLRKGRFRPPDKLLALLKDSRVTGHQSHVGSNGKGYQ
jgi:site-specific recombinase XerD